MIESPCFIEPLFPFPPGLFLSFWESSGSHHDSKLIGYPLLEGVYQDAVNVNSTACLGQSEGSGILVKVTVELVHVEGVDSLEGPIFDILWNEGPSKALNSFLKVFSDSGMVGLTSLMYQPSVKVPPLPLLILSRKTRTIFFLLCRFPHSF